MKKITLLFTIALMLNFAVKPQNSIPNGSFENWNSSTYENPQHYFSSNAEAYSKIAAFNCVKTTDAQHGSYAVRITTEAAGGDTASGYFINADPNNNFPNLPGG